MQVSALSWVLQGLRGGVLEYVCCGVREMLAVCCLADESGPFVWRYGTVAERCGSY